MTEALAYCNREPFWSRFWGKLGFGMSGQSDLYDWRNEETEGFVPSALVTETVIALGFADRVRLLISGKAALICNTKTDVLVRRSVSRSQFSVLKPTHQIFRQRRIA